MIFIILRLLLPLFAVFYDTNNIWQRAKAGKRQPERFKFQF